MWTEERRTIVARAAAGTSHVTRSVPVTPATCGQEPREGNQAHDSRSNRVIAAACLWRSPLRLWQPS
jgi:hypothetical protein